MPNSIGQGLIIGIKNAIDTVTSFILQPLKALGSKTLYPILGALGLFEVTKGLASVFKDSKANAKLAGVLLGCALALREPFRGQTVSLVGFSLGCQVIKSCLKTLLFLGATDVV